MKSRILSLLLISLLPACGDKPAAASTMPLPVTLPATYQWLTPEQVISLQEKTPGLGVLDVRDDSEMRDGNGWIGGAVPCSLFAGNDDKLKTLDRDRPWLVYCALGGRSELVAKSMATLSFQQVYLLKGGFIEWRAKKLPVIR